MLSQLNTSGSNRVRRGSFSAFARAAALLISILFAAYPLPTARADDTRFYADGPLTAEDFRGTPPDDAAMWARTVTRLHYTYKYRHSTPDMRNYTVTVGAISIVAEIRRDTSWNKRPENMSLLDHEQGHADNAQIVALRAIKDFAAAAPIKVRDKTIKAALAEVDRLLKARLGKYERQLQQDDADYDEATAHGVNGQQSEWRRVQHETLKRLEREVKGE